MDGCQSAAGNDHHSPFEDHKSHLIIRQVTFKTSLELRDSETRTNENSNSGNYQA